MVGYLYVIILYEAMLFLYGDEFLTNCLWLLMMNM